ncbi:MAG: efflux RND transporter periplasmic adaptor subunit [Phycisphaerae bacterium]|nr:efflux RND transporter periplasmic adaptor subunit [Phycisphaerae bacterium]
MAVCSTFAMAGVVMATSFALADGSIAPPVAIQNLPLSAGEGTSLSATTTVSGITAAHQTALLATIEQSRIAQILVAEGGTAGQDDRLVTLDDSVQRTQVEIAQARAESMLEINRTKARSEWAEKELAHVSELHTKGIASPKELRDAQMEADVARLDHAIARFEHEQAVREYKRQQEMLARLHIRAPFSGYVTEVLKQVGEAVDEGEIILRLVQLDPLDVWIDCPFRFADAIRTGASLAVQPLDGRRPVRTGTVFLVNRVVDPGSQTFKVKLTVDNKDAGWAAGMKVVVDFSTLVRANGEKPSGSAEGSTSVDRVQARTEAPTAPAGSEDK